MDARPTEECNPVTLKADSVRDIWVALISEVILVALRKEDQANA
jgi:hypothetical protein